MISSVPDRFHLFVFIPTIPICRDQGSAPEQNSVIAKQSRSDGSQCKVQGPGPLAQNNLNLLQFAFV